MAARDPALDPSLLSGEDLAEAALGGWHTLNPLLMGLERPQVSFLLKTELEGRRRAPLLRRLHQRLTQLRAEDERDALAEAVRNLNDGHPLDLHRFGPLQWLVRELGGGP